MREAKFPAGARVRLVATDEESAKGRLKVGDTGTTQEKSRAPYVLWDRGDVGANGVWAVSEDEIEFVEAKKKGEG